MLKSFCALHGLTVTGARIYILEEIHLEHTPDIIVTHLVDYGTITHTWRDIAFTIAIYTSLFAVVAILIKFSTKSFSRERVK